MAKVPVYLKAWAGFYLGDVEIESPEQFEDAAEKLWEEKHWDSPTLCHQCSEIELSDWETDTDKNRIEYYLKDDESQD